MILYFLFYPEQVKTKKKIFLIIYFNRYKRKKNPNLEMLLSWRESDKTKIKKIKNEMLTWLDGYNIYYNKAIVFDIDETCIHMDQHKNWYRDEEIFEIYKYALLHNFYIFFITARRYSPQNQQYTISQLTSFGFNRYNGLFLMPNIRTVTKESVGLFKNYIRNLICTNFHLLIALNIGNSWHDLLTEPLLSAVQKTSSDLIVTFQTNAEPNVGLQLKLPEHK
jgi:hypothetical protein